MRNRNFHKNAKAIYVINAFNITCIQTACMRNLIALLLLFYASIA